MRARIRTACSLGICAFSASTQLTDLIHRPVALALLVVGCALAGLHTALGIHERNQSDAASSLNLHT